MLLQVAEGQIETDVTLAAARLDVAARRLGEADVQEVLVGADFRDRRLGDITVSLAGPASNVLLALGFGGLLLGARLLGFAPEALVQLCAYGVLLNFVLAVFNLLPVPPLDGSHVVANLLPPRAAYAYRSLGAFGLVIVIVLLMVPGLLGLVFLPAQIATRLVLGAVTSL